jgi:hypothetical protein
MSSDEPAKLIKSASTYVGKAEDVTIKLLGPAGTWQVSSRLYLRNIYGSGVLRSPAGRESTLAGGDPSWDLRKRARALCEDAVNGTKVAYTTSAKGDSILSDSYRRSRDSRSGNSDSDGDNSSDNYDNNEYKVIATVRTNRRWDLLEERRLLV